MAKSSVSVQPIHNATVFTIFPYSGRLTNKNTKISNSHMMHMSIFSIMLV